jgi:hypothetical protein
MDLLVETLDTLVKKGHQDQVVMQVPGLDGDRSTGKGGKERKRRRRSGGDCLKREKNTFRHRKERWKSR